MTGQRQIEELVARCVAIVVFQHNSRRSTYESTHLEDDVSTVAHDVAQMGISEQDVNRKLLEPIRSALFARYGGGIGLSLYVEFLEAYRDTVLKRSLKSVRKSPADEPEQATDSTK